MSDETTTKTNGEAAAEAQGEAAPAIDKVGVLGHAAWLMTQSPHHKHLFVGDLEWLVVPPVSLGQFRLWQDGGKPQGFATWAYISDEVEARVSAGERRLAPQEWNCGPNLWLMDLVTPFGGADKAIADLRKAAFGDAKVKTLRAAPDGKSLTVVEI